VHTKTSLVITTINSPNQILHELSCGGASRGWDVVIVGDRSSPRNFHIEGSRYFSLDKQRELPFQLAGSCPERHYTRKNLGYLIAMQAGATLIVETDDDNAPLSNFWSSRPLSCVVPTCSAPGWVNVYRYFTDDMQIWPRGFALNHLLDPAVPMEALEKINVIAPIRQSLANESPDVDAIHRLVFGGVHDFLPDRLVALGRNVWCPFNSQNTMCWHAAYPLLYLPATCSFRATDILRSYVAQRILWENNWSLLFESPTMIQHRNEHDLMKDLSDEVVIYRLAGEIARQLSDLPLRSGGCWIMDNILRCYEVLEKLGTVSSDEMRLLNHWLSDVATVWTPDEGSVVLHNLGETEKG